MYSLATVIVAIITGVFIGIAIVIAILWYKGRRGYSATSRKPMLNSCFSKDIRSEKAIAVPQLQKFINQEHQEDNFYVVFSVDGNGRITTKGFDDEEEANDYYCMEYARLAHSKKQEKAR